jgi:hypothetical protein
VESPAANAPVVDTRSAARDAFYLTQDELAELLGQVYSDEEPAAEA